MYERDLDFFAVEKRGGIYHWEYYGDYTKELTALVGPLWVKDFSSLYAVLEVLDECSPWQPEEVVPELLMGFMLLLRRA